MPAYFSMSVLFKHGRVKPNFVKEFYAQVISDEFRFKSGYLRHENAHLDEITEWNQKWLEKCRILGYKYYHKHDDIQMIFQTEYYSELRGYWYYSHEEVSFNLIVPEYDILNCEGGSYFIESKIAPMKKLAVKLWETKYIDVIQTSVESDCGFYGLSKVIAGKNISVNPFAIIPKSVFVNFSNNYFDKMKIQKINNTGVFIEKVQFKE